MEVASSREFAIFLKRGAFLPLISIKQRRIPLLLGHRSDVPSFCSFTWRASYCFSESFRFRDNCGNELPLDSCHQALKPTPHSLSSSFDSDCPSLFRGRGYCGNFKNDSKKRMRKLRCSSCLHANWIYGNIEAIIVHRVLKEIDFKSVWAINECFVYSLITSAYYWY